jgi:hypothetical protein
MIKMKLLAMALGVLGIAAAFLFLNYPLISVLEIRAAKTGKLLFCTRVAEGEEFVLSFTHSVNKRPVYDTIRVEDGHLVVVGSRFDSFGAGMPDGARFSKDGSLEWIVNRPVPEITFFVGWVANHTIELKGRKLALVNLAQPGTLLSVRTEKVSRYELWKGRCER